MSVFKDKNILLGITGGIASYKTPILVRNLIKQGASVRIVMTPAAKDFVTPLTLSTLSNYPVLSDFTADVLNNLWADIMIIAPATANTLAAMSNGNCNNLLLATYLSAQCPIYIAPAMDLDMFKNTVTQKNLADLEKMGNNIIPPTEGFLASGLEGKGRMEEPENIIKFIENHWIKKMPLYQKKVLITAGPTYEYVDPVRFIGNHSSGKMGFELAKAGRKLGAKVTLVIGPSALPLETLDVCLKRVMTSEEMMIATAEAYDDSDIVIAAAAVSDFKPKEKYSQKIKKQTNFNTISLVPTDDILAKLGATKQGQFLVGFALETENEEKNALKKLEQKNLDAIVLNSLKDKNACFKSPTNKISFISKKAGTKKFDLKLKSEVAADIFNEILKEYDA